MEEAEEKEKNTEICNNNMINVELIISWLVGFCVGKVG